MTIIYRISDAGYAKQKPTYVNNESCLYNAIEMFPGRLCDWIVIADNCCTETLQMIKNLIHHDAELIETKEGNGAATFNIALDKALALPEDEVVYFLENDYLHLSDARKILQEGIELGAEFVSLYDHPDKYIPANRGGNPYVEDGGEVTKVYLTESTHWKLTNSTTMTFAAKVSTLKKYESIMRKHTVGTHPNDFQMFLEMKASLITPIPGRSTHGETAWLSPLINWQHLDYEQNIK